MCPDVISLHIQEWLSEKDSLKALKSFYTSLYVLSRSHHLTKLRRVRFELQQAPADQVLAYHQQAMLQLKHSLTHLQVVDSTMVFYMQPPPRFVEWFDQLQDFPRLTTVEINVGSLTYFYEMDPFIEKMGPTVTNISTTMSNSRVLQPLKCIDLTTIARHASIRTLKLAMDIIQTEDIDYIAHKFDKLSELEITVRVSKSNAALSLNDGLRTDNLLKQFFKYLTGLSKYLVTNIFVPNRLLRQTLIDLKRCFEIKHLTLSNFVPTCQGTRLSIKSLSRTRNDHRSQVYLDLEIGTAELLSTAELIYEVLHEDVVELQFGDGLVEHHREYNSSPIQGEALQLGINLLPLLKTLTASNPIINSMKSIVDPEAPKLALDLLKLSTFTNLDALFQMSQRIQHIKKWVAPHFVDYNGNVKCQDYVVNMPFTTFGEIQIEMDILWVRRYIVKLSTSTNTTYHGAGLDKKLPTEDDY